MTTSVRSSSLIERLVRALILDRTLYEEVAGDRAGLSQAIGVVILAGLANGTRFVPALGNVGLLLGIFVSLVSWLMLGLFIHATGAGIARPPRPSYRKLVACLGFADMPAVVTLFGALPVVGDFVRIIVWFWLLAACLVATRAAFKASLARGALIGGLGFGAYFLLGVVVSILMP
ncbi:MAG: hypothetical protein HY699_17030 [Deltaproteobacteria bacterium]|nr:hypothetical protein [Deltaproteobacteria bacterium]